MKPATTAGSCGILVILAALSLLLAADDKQKDPPRADIVIADFEEPTYGGWTTTGAAFKPGPALGDLLTKLEIENQHGKGVASSEIEGDGATGTLTSPAFKIERQYISFLIGGGHYEHHTCLNLLIDGKIIHSATGWKSDHLVAVSWDVSALAGQVAQVQLVDEASGDWGHINVDQIVQTDNPRRLPLVTTPLYGETFRPQFHFTARQWTIDRLNPREREEGWLNDLNGMIFYEGEYHLFAQRWNKCWIHAVSRDLIHWTELAPAFWEEKLDSGVQSGTCVVDYQNTSGLSGDKSIPPLVAFWSRNDNRSQCLSYSLDRGRTWNFYDKNPIMDCPERDPKVFWHAPSKQWVMMLYGHDQYHIFTSANLLNWTDQHKPIKNSFECPDFFQLPVDGNRDNMKWVLIQGNGKYSIGAFDGTEFKEETERLACDIGPNFYATQTFANTETGDGRRIQCAWMRGGVYPNMPFNQQVSFPCELTLHTTPAGLRLRRVPIGAIALRHQQPDTWKDRTLNRGQTLPLAPAGSLFHMVADLGISDGAKLTLNLCGAEIVLTSKTIQSGRARADLPTPLKSLEILLDRTSVETFVNQGEVSSSRCFLPERSGLSLKADNGPVTIHSLALYPLKSALKK